MRNKISGMFSGLLLLMLVVIPSGARGGTDFTAEQQAFLQQLTGGYHSWQRVELNGKLKMQELPLNPSLRIYMERGSKIYISVRAPFLGEVGRLELSGTGLTAVNKMRKVYVREDISALLGGNLPVRVEDIQDLLLGRVFLTGSGTLSAENQNECRLYDEGDCRLLIPKEQPAGGAVRYGYTIDYDVRLQDMYVTTVSGSYALLLEYGYEGKKSSIDVNVQLRSKSYAATLQFDAPKWDVANGMTAIDINPSWRRISISEFIKSFG